MKLSKLTLVLVIGGILILALVKLGLTYFNQLSDQDQLNLALESAKQQVNSVRLEPLTEKQEQLQIQYSQLNTQLQNDYNSLFSSNNSINVSDTLLKIAGICGIRITGMMSSGVYADNRSGVDCSAISLSLQIEGTLQNSGDFIVELSREFPASVIKNSEVLFSATDQQVDTSVNLVIYRYSG